ncbi:tRNA lysidine(34) synthetase TilS, partial [bacterium]|nr:tRNA lysidine(34) synthetase TilS [bacterium]
RGPGVRDGAGLEEAARRLRRGHLASVLDAQPRLAACATGHHRDDQLETLVMRFFRGAGAEGMRGIRPVAGRTIHPLLVTDRAEIEAFLAESGQAWRGDPTNEDGSNARGRVRHELLPVARAIFGESVTTAPLRLAQLLDDDVAELEKAAGGLLDGILAKGDGDSLPVDVLTEMSQPLASRLVRMHLRERCGVETDLERAHVVRLLDWLPESRSGSCVDLIDGWRACRDFDRLVFVPPRIVDEISPTAALSLSVRRATAEEIARPAPELGSPVSGPHEWRLTLPDEALRGEPRLRGWRPGDRIVPFGMHGHKKVSDLLREFEVPIRARRDVVLVEDDEGPLWLVGLVRAERTRLLPSTAAAVTLLVRGIGAAGARGESNRSPSR